LDEKEDATAAAKKTVVIDKEKELLESPTWKHRKN